MILSILFTAIKNKIIGNVEILYWVAFVNVPDKIKRITSLQVLSTGKQIPWKLQHQTENERKVWRYQREVIRIHISKKNRQHNGQKKKYKKTNNNLQNIHIKLKPEPHNKPGVNSGAPEG